MGKPQLVHTQEESRQSKSNRSPLFAKQQKPRDKKCRRATSHTVL